jgi:hypothetical protein
MAAQMQELLKAPAKSDELAVAEREAHDSAEAESEQPEPVQTARKDESSEPVSTTESATEKASSTAEQATSQASSAVEQATTQASSALERATSQASDALEPITSKVSAALQPEEPLVDETVPGSADVPGAFPGSGPDLDNDAKPSTAAVEEKDIEAPAAKEEKEGAGYSQTYAG